MADLTPPTDYRAVAPFPHEPYAFQMIMCTRCGSLVFDMIAHESMHPVECKHEHTHMRGFTQVCDDCGQGRQIDGA